MSKARGFSLIELMIVVLIIAIGTSMAIFFVDNSEDRLRGESRKLLAMVQYCRDDAVIRGKALAIQVHETEYHFLEYKNKQWQILQEKPYKKMLISHDMRLKVFVDGERSDSQNDIPDLDKKIFGLIYFLPSGEVSAFQIQIKNDDSSSFTISASAMGELSLRKTVN